METLFIAVSKSQKTNVCGVLPASNEDCLVQAKVPIKKGGGVTFYHLFPQKTSWVSYLQN